jgi:hypothetical protein
MTESAASAGAAARGVARYVLLGFIAVAIVTLVVKEVRGGKRSPAPDPAPASVSANEPQAPAAESRRVVVYYFHGNFRCVTCNTIEAYARESVAALDGHEGVLDSELKVVNVDEPANRHYAADYKLETRTVVVAEFMGDEQVRYKKLEGVWNVVKDKPAFLAYVQHEVEAYLAEPAGNDATQVGA